MRTPIIILLILIADVSNGQTKNTHPKQTLRIDTLLFNKDTINLFVREIWDTTIVKTYYCSVDSIDRSFRYGFLHLKKGLYREYSFKNIRDIKYYPRPKKYNDYRGPDAQTLTILRLK